MTFVLLLSATAFGFSTHVADACYTVPGNNTALGPVASPAAFWGDMNHDKTHLDGVYAVTFTFVPPKDGNYNLSLEVEGQKGGRNWFAVLKRDGQVKMTSVDAGKAAQVALTGGRLYGVTLTSDVGQYQSVAFSIRYRVRIDGVYADSKNQATLEFDPQGGKTVWSREPHAVGAWIRSLPTDIERENHTLVGWFAPNGAQVTESSQTPMPASGIKLTARWKAGEDPARFRDVAFHADGGHIVDMFGNDLGVSKATVNVSLRGSTWPSVVRTDYAFAGWYTKATGGIAAADLPNLGGVTDLYAHWTYRPEVYVVSYQPGNYASGSAVSDKKTKYVPLTLRGALFTRSGHLQTGWSVRQDGKTCDYDLEGTYSAERQATLYPCWAEVSTVLMLSPSGVAWPFDCGPYFVAFGCDARSNVLPKLTCERGKVYALPGMTWALSAGRSFLGWRKESNGRLYDDVSMVFDLGDPGETVEVTAVWR